MWIWSKSRLTLDQPPLQELSQESLERGRVDVQAIGAGAVNQAVKAIAIARGYLELDNIEIACVPSFTEVLIDGKERTAMRLAVESGFTMHPPL
jgi:stage V sporulation protein SpoVS